MDNRTIGESELILNPDGSIFHLHLHPEEVADDIILVGDPARVETVASFFDKVETQKSNREFFTQTGWFNGKRFTAISTGIGTDNIDIVLHELDAVRNIDLKTRQIKDKPVSLNFVRVGTSGSLQADLPIETPLLTEVAIGFDGLLNFYAHRERLAEAQMEADFYQQVDWNPLLAKPYFVRCAEPLARKMDFEGVVRGMTVSAPGFYGPQGRALRLAPADPLLNDKLARFSHSGLRVTNFEMEGSAIYGLSKLMGHQAVTLCSIIANRIRKEYSKDYKAAVKKLLENVLVQLSS